MDLNDYEDWLVIYMKINGVELIRASHPAGLFTISSAKDVLAIPDAANF